MTAPLSPTLESVLTDELARETKPIAVVLAGHNGSGKSTLWYQRLANHLRVPLVNADRLTMSMLPEPAGIPPSIPTWAQTLRDEDAIWQSLSQRGVKLFRELIMERRQAFGFETVFSHWRKLPGGKTESKIDDIVAMQQFGYVVVLIFVGLTAPPLSIVRVQHRRQAGAHDVPVQKLTDRFLRTQNAIGAAAGVADLTLMVDNSLDEDRAYQLVRAQRKRQVLFDARDPHLEVPADVLAAATPWIDRVIGPFRPR